MSYFVFYFSHLHVYVRLSGLITSVGEDRATVLLSCTCKYVVCVRRGFLFLLMLYFIVALAGPSLWLFQFQEKIKFPSGKYSQIQYSHCY